MRLERELLETGQYATRAVYTGVHEGSRRFRASGSAGVFFEGYRILEGRRLRRSPVPK